MTAVTQQACQVARILFDSPAPPGAVGSPTLDTRVWVAVAEVFEIAPIHDSLLRETESTGACA